MRIGWIGFHREGIASFEALLRRGKAPVGLVTLTEEQARKRSGAGDYEPLCRRYKVPIHRVRNVNDAECFKTLHSMDLDVAFVLGWCQILKSEALHTARLGMIGAHASLLPKNRGSAPVNWAIINGETMTGNSLIWLADNVDQGHLIDQRAFEISPYDTCATIYDKVAQSNRDMVLALVERLGRGERPGQPQTELDRPLLTRRRPEDGLIVWDQPGSRVYDFVRALTRPYPGAFGFLGAEKWRVWKAALLPFDAPGEYPPGSVVGPVYSPDESACGQMVTCSQGGLLILEAEDAEGNAIRGRELCERRWKGKVFSNAA